MPANTDLIDSKSTLGSLPVLVLVHAGSACGSADFNIGRSEARCGREALVMCLNAHHGGVVIVDGFLSDEIPSFPELNAAIANALDQARGLGQVALRVKGCDSEDHDQTKAIEAVLAAQPELKDLDFIVTGAWYEPPNHDDPEPGGCVGSVLLTLASHGVRARIHDSALEPEST
jgi:hypothetical protein